MGIAEPDHDKVVKELTKIIKERIDEGQEEEVIMSDLQNNGFELSLIEEAFKKLKLI